MIGLIIAGGDPLEADIPVLSGFNFSGGYQLSPEFAALLVGLVTYTAAFIAEVVRAGIQCRGSGSIRSCKCYRIELFPIAQPGDHPPGIAGNHSAVNQPIPKPYQKHSSLAVFIGYPELFFIGKTDDQPGRTGSTDLFGNHGCLSEHQFGDFVNPQYL